MKLGKEPKCYELCMLTGYNRVIFFFLQIHKGTGVRGDRDGRAQWKTPLVRCAGTNQYRNGIQLHGTFRCSEIRVNLQGWWDERLFRKATGKPEPWGSSSGRLAVSCKETYFAANNRLLLDLWTSRYIMVWSGFC